MSLALFAVRGFVFNSSSLQRSSTFLLSKRMLRLLALLLTVSVAANSVAYAAAKAPMDAAIARQQVTQRGVGKKLKLVRKDGSEIKGSVVSIGADAVEVQVKGSATPVAVPFADVAAVKNFGLSTGAKVGIGVGIGLVVAVGVAALVIKHEIDKPWNF